MIFLDPDAGLEKHRRKLAFLSSVNDANGGYNWI